VGVAHQIIHASASQPRQRSATGRGAAAALEIQLTERRLRARRAVHYPACQLVVDRRARWRSVNGTRAGANWIQAVQFRAKHRAQQLARRGIARRLQGAVWCAELELRRLGELNEPDNTGYAPTR
jgi:hypothetical protein